MDRNFTHDRRGVERPSALRFFWSGIWTGALTGMVVLMLSATGCRNDQPPSPRVTAPRMNSVIFLDRQVESEADRIIEGVLET